VKRYPAVAAVILAAGLGGCGGATLRGSAMVASDQREARPFDPAVSDAAYALTLDQAIARLDINSETPRKALVVFGANWCHDSRVLAGWLLDPKNASFLRDRFETVFIDVATPQDGKGRNLDLAARYGLGDLRSTPAVVVLDHGKRLNSIEDAKGWRNAGSRGNTAISTALASYAAFPSEP